VPGISPIVFRVAGRSAMLSKGQKGDWRFADEAPRPKFGITGASVPQQSPVFNDLYRF
jgi:hypothetical protein